VAEYKSHAFTKLLKVYRNIYKMSNIIRKEDIISRPEFYFDTQKKGLEQRLAKVKLTQEEEEAIIASKTSKAIRDKVLGVFKIGEIINTILNWNEEIDEDLKEAKKEYLLASYFDKAEQTGEAVEKLKQLLTNPQGNTIFNKILRILDNTPPDIELTKHLATVLNHIAASDFVALFEDHKFALNQIEMLTPQALTLLSDHRSWPVWTLTSYSSNGARLTSHWLPDFVNVYSMSKGILDSSTKSKISHSMNDLIKNLYAEGMLTTKEKTAAAFLTEIGKLIIKYIE
jgi:hypothetical protein